MPRLFTALEIPQDIAVSLSLLRGGLSSARWIDPENYHLTLRFIGDIEPRLADEIVAALDRIERSSLRLSLSGLGAFGNKKPHSVYAEVAPSPELAALQADIDRACRRLGLAPDQRKFLPHVTLARVKNGKPSDVAHYLALRGGFRSRSFTVERFGLFSSRDSIGGGPYVLEEAFDLGRGEAFAPAPARADTSYAHDYG
ncbi:RNA 2',3'-cyclic phosphodiesterase [Jiella endophytica]|uniref:RNA 2',3'-cyclic phosphodiesterase n=1 Tax=Jiella endophytica TaxID=2558362 RepID=A0A4Y8RD10_9HYPH|nr:RNA 2',3'-cyclic phosphodiesterase [Jiella endophytica]TFF19915.1 RNA 2',3'-cyclic phosphodiesterase [Jiella endophytica]